MIVTIGDIRKYHCVKGIRNWFKLYNLNFDSFLKDGIDSEILLKTNDVLATRVVNGINKNG